LPYCVSRLSSLSYFYTTPYKWLVILSNLPPSHLIYTRVLLLLVIMVPLKRYWPLTYTQVLPSSWLKQILYRLFFKLNSLCKIWNSQNSDLGPFSTLAYQPFLLCSLTSSA
jgi:hypothetical protein